MKVLVVTGTGTDVGKTVVAAAIAATAAAGGWRVAVVKPGQTGVADDEPGDLDEVRRLTGIDDLHEYGRFRDPLAPATAARMEGRPPVDLRAAAEAITILKRDRDLVVVEGAGGLLVRYDDRGSTLADLADRLNAPVVVVAEPALGTLNHTALTVEALQRRGLVCGGVVLGRWPAEPDLACRANLVDLPRLPGVTLAGALPDGAGRLDPVGFAEVARAGLHPTLGGTFDAADFAARFPVAEAALTPAPKDAP